MQNNDLFQVVPKKKKKYTPRVKRMTIVLDPELFERFNRIAKEYNLNKSRTIANYLNEFCDRIEEKGSKNEK